MPNHMRTRSLSEQESIVNNIVSVYDQMDILKGSPVDFDLSDSGKFLDHNHNPEISPVSASLKYIEPDVASINKLLNFDEGEESCDDILNESFASDIGKAAEVDVAVEKSSESGIKKNINFENEDPGEVVYQPNIAEMHTSLKKEFSSSWSEGSLAMVTASLTLEEVGHIRKVHAKADMESLPVDCNIKQDVVAGKLCFQCLKTKFGFFCRRNKCPVCSQHVCSRCLNKVSVTPFFLLPQSSRGRGEVKFSSNSDLTKPRERRRSTYSCHSETGSRSVDRRQQGSVLSVCFDCKETMVQLIQSHETNRKREVARKKILEMLSVKKSGVDKNFTEN